MLLPERFYVTIQGELWDVRQRANIVPEALPRLLGMLFQGEVAAAHALTEFGLRVTIEEDTDQGDDGPDMLVVPREM